MSVRTRATLLGLALAASASLSAAGADANVTPQNPSLNFWGVTGLIDMPSGETQTDGVFNTTFATFSGITRTTLTFQMAPRLSASFRYTSLANYDPGSSQPTYYDRSFDLRYQIFTEGRVRPAVSLGLQDFVGTDIMSAEYLVATKTIAPGLKFTAGLGWGRLGSYGSIFSFGTRPKGPSGSTGKLQYKQWFRGPVAPFGGFEYQVNGRWSAKLEYSSDAYVTEVEKKHMFSRRIPINAGVEYKVNDLTRVGLYELYGSELGFSLQITLDPKTRPTGGVLGAGPAAVLVRPRVASDPQAWSRDWVSTPNVTVSLRDKLAALMAKDNLKLVALSVGADRAQVRFMNARYDSSAQAFGRVARDMSRVMPASVETFELVPVADGIPISKLTISRSDLEALEFAPLGDQTLKARSTLSDAGPLPEGAVRGKGIYPRLTWSIGPYMRTSFFDPNNPVRADLGVRLRASYAVAPGVILSGSVTKKLIGTLNQSTRASNSVLPHVRSDFPQYDKQGDPALETLTAAWYSRPAPNLYARVTAGYLERMFGGLSTEVLWQPVHNRLALGAEVDYVGQRDFNDRLGFQNYKVMTGFLSAYYKFDRGYFGRIDVGRYLAKDVGATFTLTREMANGWRIGAFATLTNVSAARFGEGSFDKGFLIRIPLNWMIGQPATETLSMTLRPLQRDGGAQLNVDGRLYDVVRAYHSGDLYSQWGRVFR